MSKIVLFRTIQFSITQRNSIWPIDRALSKATTPSKSGPGSDDNEGVLRIPHSSSITGTSPSDCLVSYARHSLRESYPYAEKQSVYSTAPADWVILQRVSGKNSLPEPIPIQVSNWFQFGDFFLLDWLPNQS